MQIKRSLVFNVEKANYTQRFHCSYESERVPNLYRVYLRSFEIYSERISVLYDNIR